MALAILRDRPDVQADRIALIGLSHGGWAALDFLALAEAGTVPPLLTEWPETLAERPHDGVRGAAMFYPYCGLASVVSAARVSMARICLAGRWPAARRFWWKRTRLPMG